MKKIKWQEHIMSDPQILYGKPCIKGTRIPVDLILEKLAYGEQVNDLLQDYPRITDKDIYACLFYAAEKIGRDLIPQAA
jgi:uncharacterized protein (DUF433 family)